MKHTDCCFDRGFNLGAGAGINFTPAFGVIGEVGYNDMGLNAAALNAARAPGGSTRILSVTANPIIRFNPRGRFGAYVVGGGGWYRRTLEFTEPTLIPVTGFDPFFGVFFPAAIPADQVISSSSQNRGGWNVGGGITAGFRGDSTAKVFAETRYHYLYTDPERTTLLPVTFGFRW